MTALLPPALLPYATDAPLLLRLLAAALLLLVLLLALWRRTAGRAAAAQARLAESQAHLGEQTARREAEAGRAIAAEARADARATRLEELRSEVDALAAALDEARAREAEIARALARATVAAEKDRDLAAQRIDELTALRDQMTAEFRALSAETLRVQAADTTRTQSETLGALLTPLRDQVQRFQSELAAREIAAGQDRAALKAQIEMLHARSEQIGQDAVQLTRALKGEKQRQGAWGEMILGRLLEDSGLEAGTHYLAQESVTDEAGKRWRPDVIVRMPQGRVLVIDAKVSLVAWERAINAEAEADRNRALAEHCRALRAHVTDLSGRGYDALDAGAVDYVLMFVPIEGAIAEALRHDPQLLAFAMERRVGVMTPMNLMLTLRTVNHIWTVERRESNAALIAKSAGDLYDKVEGFLGTMDEVGRALGKARDAHDKALNQLSRGPGNVIRRVQKLKEWGARTDKRIALDHDREDDPAPAAIAAPVDEG